MLTRIEIDGFKTFAGFELDLRPFSAVVGPNASGKSNLFDALRFMSLLAQVDIRTAMQDLRGEPEELFRRTPHGVADAMSFAVEVLLNPSGVDAFGRNYVVKARRVRYELDLALKRDSRGSIRGMFVTREECVPIQKKDDKIAFEVPGGISYSARRSAFINTVPANSDSFSAIEIRQDGHAESGTSKRGSPVKLPLEEASRTGLSTITTADFPHLYALKDLFASTRFLEINPQAARKANDRFETKILKSDASNLSAVLAHLKDTTGSDEWPDGVINDISMDLASLIPSVRKVEVFNDINAKEYSFGVNTADKIDYSSRVISDGTLRILALLAVVDDPDRRGILCFEEPENGVHEGRIASLIELLRETSRVEGNQKSLFQVLINTHSPAVMNALDDTEIVAADVVSVLDPSKKQKSNKTRMRIGVKSDTLPFDPERDLTRVEISNILRRQSGQA